MAAGAASRSGLKDYGPYQFPERLGLPLWAFERALRGGVIPPADAATGRWPASALDAALADLDRIRACVGTQPDVGAGRAADILSARFGTDVPSDALLELDRMGLISCVGHYKEYPLYDGRALENFSDRAALQRAMTDGRLLTRDAAAEYLRVRRSDLEHLIGAQWLEPVTWVRSGWQRRRSCPKVPLFRTADLGILLAHPAIDWDEVRATPAGRPSPLAMLTTRSPENQTSR